MKHLMAVAAIGVALSGCASPVVWVRPGATQAGFNMDRAHCQLMAEGMNPDIGVATIYTGKAGTDVAANLGAGILHGLAQGAAVEHTFSLCMQSAGYVPTAPVAPAPVPAMVAALPAAPVPLVPASTAPAPVPVAERMPASAVAAPARPFIPCSDGGPCGGGQSLTVRAF